MVIFVSQMQSTLRPPLSHFDFHMQATYALNLTQLMRSISKMGNGYLKTAFQFFLSRSREKKEELPGREQILFKNGWKLNCTNTIWIHQQGWLCQQPSALNLLPNFEITQMKSTFLLDLSGLVREKTSSFVKATCLRPKHPQLY